MTGVLEDAASYGPKSSANWASKDLCMDSLIVSLKRERAGLKEGANDVRAASQTADGPADAGLQHRQVRRAQPTQGVLFQPSPQPFVGVEFGGVGRQAIHAQTRAVLGQGGAGSPRTMGVAAVPEQEQGTRNLSQQMPDKADHLAAGDRACHQVQIHMGMGSHGGAGR